MNLKLKKKKQENEPVEATVEEVTPVVNEEPVPQEEEVKKPKTLLNSIEVRLENLTKEFVDKKGNVTVAVNNFTVDIEAGKLFGLLGPSGCGKSTTLYMIAGLHKPTSGKIYFGDEDVTLVPPEKRGIGLVFQNYALYPHMTVKQNIMFPLENMRVPKEEAAARAQEMAELVHIGDLMDRKPAQLSGGQQQRVAIARALVKKPKVLLLDEPLSNLDARLRLQTREEIKRIQKETGITTIFVTHDQEEAMSISDKIVVMKNGFFQQLDKPQNVYDEPQNLFVSKFLGTPPINCLEADLVDGNVVLKNGTIIEKGINRENQEIVVGIRSEFFTVSEKGKIDAEIELIEHIGRDTMIICIVPGYEHTIRAIVQNGRGFEPGQKIKLAYTRCFVFTVANDGERIR